MWLELVRGRAPVGFPYMLALFTCSASTVFHVHCSVKPTSGFFFFWYTVTSSCVYCVCVVCACVVDAHQHFCCCFFVFLESHCPCYAKMYICGRRFLHVWWIIVHVIMCPRVPVFVYSSLPCTPYSLLKHSTTLLSHHTVESVSWHTPADFV